MSEQRSMLTAMQEFYIRKEGDEDSRGPFTVEQLSSLVEAGQVDRQTFYYDSTAEKWVEIQSSPELVQALFPIKKKLAMRSKEGVPSVNVKPAQDDKPITVEDLLAAAEGQTSETKDKRNRNYDEARATHLGLRALSLIFLVSAAGLLVNNMGRLAEMELLTLISSPEIIFGVLDVILAVLLLLEMTEVYRFVRLRAAIGLGFFAVYLGVLPNSHLALAGVVVASIAAFVLTLVTKLWTVITLAVLGLAGMGGFAYFLLN